MLADMLLSEFSEELVWLTVDGDGFSDRFSGVSVVSDELELPKADTDNPDGLPLVAGSLITSTLSVDDMLGDWFSCSWESWRVDSVIKVWVL